jgi:hypothetical protein
MILDHPRNFSLMYKVCIIKRLSYSRIIGMPKPGRSFSDLHLTLLGLVVAGLVLWVVSSSGLTELLVFDASSQAIENPACDDSQDPYSPSWPYFTVKGTTNSLLSDVVQRPFSSALALLLSGALFRLKLVLLTPPIGPPRTFFA